MTDGERVTIRNPRTGARAETTMAEGGFDPIPLAASVGDTLEVDVQLAGGAGTIGYMVIVPPSRRPIVVRTDPPPRKRDVPLNATMLLVFSEPIAPATVTASTILLLRNGQPVAGSLEFRDAANLTVAFVPAAALAPNTEYELAVAQDIRDLDDETLPGPLVVTFTTVAAPYVSVVPGDTTIAQQDTVRLVATLRDANGSVVSGRPISWVVGDTGVVSLVSTDDTSALLRGVGQRVGPTTVTATIDGVSGTATITVIQPPVASVTIRPASETVPVQVTRRLIVERRDAKGNFLYGRPVTWTSDNTAIATVGTETRTSMSPVAPTDATTSAGNLR